jgi:hypothetical protein
MKVIILATMISFNTFAGDGCRLDTVDNLIDKADFEAAAKCAEDTGYDRDTAKKRIKKAQQCSSVIDRCDPSLVTDRAQARICLADFIELCQNNLFTVTSPWREKWRKVRDEIEKKIEDFNKSPAQGMCNDGLRWGYERQKKKNCTYCTVSLSVNYAALIGTFQDRDKCEEARALDEKYETSSKCYQRYLGKEKFFTLYEAKVLSVDEGSVSEFLLKFSDEQKCKNALKKWNAVRVRVL